MGMPKLKKFLCCASLEAGGLIIGWVMTFVSLIILSFAIISIVVATSAYNQRTGINDQLAYTIFISIVIVMSIYIVYFFIVMVSSILLLRGTRKREYALLMPFMILMVIGIFISFLQFIVMGPAGILIAFFSLAIDIYFFLCIYSLYDKLKNENLGQLAGHPTHALPQQMTTVVYGQPQMMPQQPQMFGQPPQMYMQPIYPVAQPTSFMAPAAVPPMSSDYDQKSALP